MGLLPQKLRYQKNGGASGQCDIYDNINECPFPNLKVNVNGRNGWVKLSQNLSDPDATPLRAYENGSGVTFAVLKRHIPTGNATYTSAVNWTCPFGIKVVKCILRSVFNRAQYIGVTPGKVYDIFSHGERINTSENRYVLGYVRHSSTKKNWVSWEDPRYTSVPSSPEYTLEWSPTINNHSVDVQDY